MVTQQQYDEAVLSVTSGPNWEIIKEGLLNDIYQLQAGALDASSWDQVVEARGIAKGLMMIHSLRERTLSTLNAESSNATL